MKIKLMFIIMFFLSISIFTPRALNNMISGSTVNADSNDIYLEILSPEDGFSFSDKLTVDFFIENRGNEKIVFSRQSYLALMIINDDFDGDHVVPWLTIHGNYEIDPGENWTLSVEWWIRESWYYNEVSISLGHYLDTENATMTRTANIPGEYGTSDLISGVHVPSSSQLADFKIKETRIQLNKKEINILTIVGPDPRNPENSVSLTPWIEIDDGYWKRFPESYELIYSAEKGTVKPINLEGEYIYIAPDYETTDTITVSFPGTEKYAASSCTAKVNVLKNIFLDGWDVEWQVKVQPVEPHLMVNFSSPKPFTIYKIVLGGIVISEERFTVGGDFSDQIIVNNVDELIRIVGSPGRLEIWVVDAYRNPDFCRNVWSSGDLPAEWSEGLHSVRIIGGKEYRDDPIMDVWDFITGVYNDLRDWIFG